MIPTNQLTIVRAIQKKYPSIHVGGSIGLFLWGLNLDRPFKDIDLCAPEVGTMDLSKSHHYNNGSPTTDFDYNFQFKGFNIEVKIDPTQTYHLLMHLGFRYYVTDLAIIEHYKASYAAKGYDKHAVDLRRIQDFRKRKGL